MHCVYKNQDKSLVFDFRKPFYHQVKSHQNMIYHDLYRNLYHCYSCWAMATVLLCLILCVTNWKILMKIKDFCFKKKVCTIV